MIHFSAMSISVVISTFKRNELLRQILSKLEPQKKYINEIIIVDNSPKKDAKKVNMGDARYYHHNSKGGISRSRNIGIKKAKSTIIAFLDDDCFPDSNWAKNISSFFKKNKNQKDIVMGKNDNYFSDSAVSMAEYYENELGYRKNFMYKDKKIYSLALDTKNFALRRDPILKDKLFFDEQFGQYTSFEDLDFGIRARHKNYSIIFSSTICASHVGRVGLHTYLAREYQKKRGQQLYISKWNITAESIDLYNSFKSSSTKFKEGHIIKSELKQKLLMNKSILFKIRFYLYLFLAYWVRYF